MESSILVGLDACTDEQRVFQAYNDAVGLNTKFILNSLNHANVVLGYDAFNVSDWTVRGEWTKATGSHIQYLIPQKNVLFEGKILKAGMKIPVVNSFKYDAKQQAQLWTQARLMESERWCSRDGSYGELGFNLLPHLFHTKSTMRERLSIFGT